MERDVAMEWVKDARIAYDNIKTGRTPAPEGKDPHELQEEARDELYKACRALEEADKKRLR